MIGWRAHLGAIFPTPVPGRVIREFYEVVPDGVDLTASSLTIRQLAKEDLEEATAGIERAAEQMARFEVDRIYFLGVPPIVLRGPGYDRELIARMEKAAGRPASTDITGVMEAFRALGLRRLVMAARSRANMVERGIRGSRCEWTAGCRQMYGHVSETNLCTG